MTVGYGHGIAVTPLHLASGYASLFNGGVYRPATLLKVDAQHPRAKGVRVFSEDTSYQMRSLLRLVVTKAPARKRTLRATASAERPDRRKNTTTARSW
jgi:cell division protein FtsI (penicillin-binding protein 3)